MVISIAIEVLVTQNAFLLEPKGLMKLDRARVVRQRLTTDFMEL